MRAPTTPELITAFFVIATLALIIAIPSIVDEARRRLSVWLMLLCGAAASIGVVLCYTVEADTAYEALTGKPASGSRHERAGAEGSRGNGGAAGQAAGPRPPRPDSQGRASRSPCSHGPTRAS
jgi:hypothetical protein